jgi:hypothetical protein
MFPTDLEATTWSVMKGRLDTALRIAAKAAGVME